MSRRVKTIGWVAALLLALASGVYWAFTPPEIAWQEEVQLADRRVVVVDRWSKREASGELGHRGAALWWQIKARKPDTTETVVWDEDAGAIPEIFDFVSGVPYLAARVGLYSTCKKYGWPKLDWVFFKYDGGWKRISFEQFPPHLDSNLLVAAWHADAVDRLRSPMTLARKNEYVAAYSQKATSLRRDYEERKHLPGNCQRFGQAQADTTTR